MDVIQIKERISKKEEAIKKAERLFDKYTAELDDSDKQLIKDSCHDRKLYAELISQLDNKYGRGNWGWSVKGKDAESARSNWQKKLECEEQLAKYQIQLKNSKKKTSDFENMPQIMKDAEAELIKEWDEYDAKHKAELRKAYNKLEAKYPKNSIEGYKEFIDIYKYSSYKFMHESAADTHKNNVREARAYILDLYNRVVAKTGNITNVEGLRLNGPALNGRISGKDGTVEVETILAGGYNIQRLHCRTLVHLIKYTKRNK